MKQKEKKDPNPIAAKLTFSAREALIKACKSEDRSCGYIIERSLRNDPTLSKYFK